MQRRPVRRVGVVLLFGGVLGLVGAACTGSDEAAPSTTTPSRPIEFDTLPPVSEAATTDVGTGPSPDSVPTNPPIEPAIAMIEGAIPASVEAFGLAAPSVVEFAGLPLADVTVSPSGRWLAINRGSEICLLDPAIGSASADEGCVDVPEPSSTAAPGPVAPGSLAWSPDESTVAFVLDWPQEPDIAVLDVASLSIAVLTDDGPDGTDFDVAPFYGDDGTLHFLRSILASFPPSFEIIEFGDRPITVGSLQTEGFVSSARRDPVGGLVVVEIGDTSSTSIETIDLVEGTSTLLEGEVDSINRWPFLDVAGDRAVIGQNPVPEVGGTRAARVDRRGVAAGDPVGAR